MRPMMFLLVVAATLVWGSETCLCAFEIVDFDDLDVGGPVAYAGGDRYSALGITFLTLIPIEDVQRAEPGYFPTFLGAGGSGTNGLGLSVLYGQLSIQGVFQVPGTSIAAVTDNISIDAFDTEVGTLNGLLEVFDGDGNLIDSLAIVTPPSTHSQFSISHPGIASFRLSMDGDGGIWDNLTFNTPIAVPAPAAIVLSSVGMALVGWLRRRRAI